MVNRDALKTRLIREEGLRLAVYADTVGKLSVGVGHNLSDNGISRAVAMQMLDEDMDYVIQELAMRGMPWFSGLDQVRQQVCCDMCFNLGPTGFFKFTKMVQAIAGGDFHAAAQEMLASHWAKQVGGRADILAAMMETGCE